MIDLAVLVGWSIVSESFCSGKTCLVFQIFLFGAIMAWGLSPLRTSSLIYRLELSALKTVIFANANFKFRTTNNHTDERYLNLDVFISKSQVLNVPWAEMLCDNSCSQKLNGQFHQNASRTYLAQLGLSIVDLVFSYRSGILVCLSYHCHYHQLAFRWLEKGDFSEPKRDCLLSFQICHKKYL